MKNRCFECSGPHHAKHKACPGSNQGCWYKCIYCQERNNISSRGASRAQAPERAVAAAAASTTAAAKAVAKPVLQPVAKAVGKAAAGPPPPANLAPVLKRPAGQSFKRQAPALSLDECWERCRKKGRYGAVKDVLKDMDTVQAGKSVGHIDENAPRWSTRFGWVAGEYKKGIAEFSAHQAGGSPGVGCTREAMVDVYRHHAM